MRLLEVLTLLQQNNIQISLENEQLKVSAAKGAMTKELMLILKENKEALLSWAKEQASNQQGLIERLPRDQDFPLSYNQQRLWLLHKIQPETASYNMPMAIRLSVDTSAENPAALNIGKLEQALNSLIARHDAFRTRLIEKNIEGETQARQSILAPHHHETRLKLNAQSIPADKVQSIVQQEALKPFELLNQALWRIQLFSLEEQDSNTRSQSHILMLNMHHIIGDRVTLENLFKELAQLYVTGSEQSLAPLTFDYPDFAAWQAEQSESGALDAQLEYWQQTLAGVPSVLHMPQDFSQVTTQQAKTFDIQLPQSLVAKARDAAQAHKLTPFMFYFAVQQLLFAKLANQDDFCTGVPIAGRHLAGTQDLIGYFVNTLALRTTISHNPKLSHYLQQVREHVLNAFDHQDAPLDAIIEGLKIPPSRQHNSLIQYGFNYINQQVDIDNSEALNLDGLLISPIDIADSEAKYDQIWSFNDQHKSQANTLHLSIEYHAGKFKAESVDWFAQNFIALCETVSEAILKQDDCSVKALEAFKASDLHHKIAEPYQELAIERLQALTPMQQDLQLDSLLAPDSLRNYFGASVVIPELVEPELLEQAIQLLSQKYSSLRQRIVPSTKLFTQSEGLDPAYAIILQQDPAIKLERLELEKDLSSDVLYREAQALSYQSIDIENEPLTRFYLACDTASHSEQSCLIVCVHHCASDLIAMRTLIARLSECYHGLKTGLNSKQILTQLAEDIFPDIIASKKAQKDSEQSLRFWQEQIQTAQVEALSSQNYLASQKRSDSISQQYQDHIQTIDAKHFNAIKQYCAQQAISIADYLKAVFALCISSYSYHDTHVSGLAFNEAIAARPPQQSNTGLGCYFEQRPVVLPPLKHIVDSNFENSFSALVNAIKAARQKASYTHSISNHSITKLFPHDEASFQFNLYLGENRAEFNQQQAIFTIIPPQMDNAVNFIAAETEQGLKLNLTYLQAHFSGQHFLSDFIQRSSQICLDGIEQLASLKSPVATHSVDEAHQQKSFKPLIQSIFEQAEKQADATAIIHGEEQLSYAQLICYSAAISQVIQQALKQNQIALSQQKIAFCLPKSIESIASILAILQSGHSYIPIDSNYPSDRIQHILQDANASLIISVSDIQALNDIQALRINLDDAHLLARDYSALTNAKINIKSNANSNNKAAENVNASQETFSQIINRADFSAIQEQHAFYSIYTSGSTGLPKGASVSQRNVQYLADWYRQSYAINAQDRVYILSALGFDLSQKNIYTPLMAGATLVLPSCEDYQAKQYLSDIQEQQVSLINCAPSAFYPLIESLQDSDFSALKNLRYVLFGGENIRLSALTSWLESKDCKAQIVNMYGPTECTDISTAFTITEPSRYLNNEAIPIGTSPDFVQCYVVDSQLQALPQGVAGELIITGPSLGLGYIENTNNQNQKLNQEKFVSPAWLNGAKAYRTGDFVVENAAHEYIFLSRLDHQVKIRGLRIELGEIEQQLKQVELIQDSLCLVEDETITAYLLVNDQTQHETIVSEATQALSKSLADYMLPSRWLSLEAWPLTANGKIDRKALPKAEHIQREIIPATSDTQKLVLSIWQSVLGLDEISIRDNFFQLGGHSLLAARIASQIEEQTGKQIALRDVFEEPTIEYLAQLLEQQEQQSQNDQAAKPRISVQAKDETKSLSFAQERLWFIDQLNPNSNQYNIPFALRLSGQVNIQALQQSFDHLVERHQVLQSCIRQDNAQALLSFEHRPTLIHNVSDEDDAALKQRAAQTLLKPFSLSQEPLARFELIERQAPAFEQFSSHSEYLLLIALHHIIADGWSIDILMAEIIQLYQHYAYQAPLQLPALNIQYSDYANYQRLHKHEHKADLDYWQTRLKGSSLVDLPLDFDRPKQLSLEGKQLGFSLSAELSHRLKQFSADQNISLFSLLQSSFSLLLSLHSGQNDIVLGTPTANRELNDTQSLIGFFANTLVLRSTIDQKQSFADLCLQSHQNTLNDLAHQDIQFESLVDKLDIARELNQTPLFNVMLVLQANSQGLNNAGKAVELPGLKLSSIDDLDALDSAKYDLTLNMLDDEQELKGTLEYRTSLFEQASIENLLQHFESLLSTVIDHPFTALNKLSLNNSDYIHSLGNIQSQDSTLWPALNTYTFKPFIQRFEKIADEHANAPALFYNDHNDSKQLDSDKQLSDEAYNSLSFKALNQSANQLAHFIQAKTAPCIQVEDRIAVFLPRGKDMMQSLLAIQKVQAAYVPIDLSLPYERVSYMLKNSQAKYLILNEATLQSAKALKTREALQENELEQLVAKLELDSGCKIINLDSERVHIQSSKVDNLGLQASASQLAYVLYTSGSTGVPKGTLVEQLGFDHYLQFASHYYYEHAEQAVVSSSLSFDATITSLYSSFLKAKPVRLTRQDDDDFKQLAELIFSQCTASLFKITPAHIELLSAQYADCINQAAHIFIVGGDQLKKHQLQAFKALLPQASFVNEYGPTETVVGCCVEFIHANTDLGQQASNIINIGKPISHCQLYVLDEQQNIVPRGRAGELYIAGFGVARGYLDREAETKKAFLSNPFSLADNLAETRNIERLYRTGDIVKQQSDGKFIYLGRADNQVKIRGLRIELEEIEQQLQAIEGIQEAVVLAIYNNQHNNQHDDVQLAAYYSSNKTISSTSIKQALSKNLPAYMLPSAYTALPSLPLTSNGKLDKKALLAIDIQTTVSQELIQPETVIEEQLFALWQDLLASKPTSFGVSDNFFDVGGHSLLAIQLASHIEQSFHVSVSVRDIFEYPSIRAQASFIEVAETLDSQLRLPAIQARPQEQLERLPLSFNQQRLWFVYQLDKSAASYNMPTALRIKGQINITALEQAAKHLIARHELLRTSIHEDASSSYQSIHAFDENAQDFKLSIQSLTAEQLADEAYIKNLLTKESQAAFVLEEGFLFKVSLWQSANTSVDETLILINMHHIIGDAISLEVLVQELVQSYFSFDQGKIPDLSPQPFQYADYALWQQEHLQGEFLDQQLQWWHEKLAGAPALLNLPTDKARPARQTHNGNITSLVLDQDIVDKLRRFSQQSGLTPFMVLLAAQQLLLGKLANQDDVCIGVPLAGRHQTGTEKLLGFFINALVIRSEFKDNPNTYDFLQQVKQNVLEAFAHQDAPFEKVIEQQGLANNPAHSPIVQIGFNYIHQQQNPLELINDYSNDFTIEGIALEHSDAKYEQIWAFLDNGESIHLSLEYNTDLFEYESIESWIQAYQVLLTQVLNEELSELPVKRLSFKQDNDLLTQLDWDQLSYSIDDVESLLPLTPMQRDMYLDQQFDPENRRNYLGWIQHADQIIDIARFQQAVDIINNHHSALRMRIVASKQSLADEAYQLVLKPHASRIQVQSLDWSQAGENQQALSKHAFDLRCDELGFAPYDMANDALLRLYIIKDTANSHTIVLSAHHTCIDGLSMQNITKAYIDLYEKLADSDFVAENYFGQDQYADYVKQQTAICDNHESLSFWQNTMQAVESPKPFAHGKLIGKKAQAAKAQANKVSEIFSSGAQEQKLEKTYISREVKDSPEHMAAMEQYCKQHNIAPITYLKAVYALMIQSCSFADKDFFFNEILAARPKGYLQDIGCFFEQRPTVVPTTAIKADSFLGFLQAMEDYRLEVRSAGRISNSQQQRLFAQGGASFLFNFYLMPRTLPFADGELRMNFITPEMTDTVTFTCIIDGDSLLYTFSYSDNVFNDQDFVERFILLSQQILAGEDQISALKLNLDNEESYQASSLENTKSDEPVYRYHSVIEAIEAQVNKTPKAIACTDQNSSLSYEQLNQKANHLAKILQKQLAQESLNDGESNGDSEDKHKQKTRIAICLEAGTDFLVSLVAVLKTGASYIPIDSAYPIGRIQYILKDAKASCLISRKSLIQNLQTEKAEQTELEQENLFTANLVLIDQLEYSDSTIDNIKPEKALTLDDSLYTIYTSGSTGLPKGAEVSQRGELNLINWYTEHYNIKAEDRFLIISALGFDLTQKNLLSPLCVGASVIFNQEDYDPQVICQLIEEQRISLINCAPSAFYPLIEQSLSDNYRALESLRLVLFGGEPIRADVLSPWLNMSDTQVVNMYGPTECTDIACAYTISDINAFTQRNIPIGSACQGVRLAIADSSGRLLPKGFSGELYISGESVGLGYIDRPELNQSSFIQHPILGRCYKTGDLVKWRDDGLFEFISRIDNQVKIRGLRIELGEIEWAFKSLAHVSDALLMADNDKLLAYLISDKTVEDLNWRSQVAQQLPAYMLPQEVHCIEQWPLTANGKVDRKALLALSGSSAPKLIIKARNDIEEALLAIFETHLQTPVSVDDNFFELGGHSLLAARAVNDIREHFNKELPLREVFLSPSVEAIAKLIEQDSLADADHLAKALPELSDLETQIQSYATSFNDKLIQQANQGQFPLSLQQQRLWLIEQIQGPSTMYAMPMLFKLSGDIDLAALRLAIKYLGDQFSILRTHISQKQNQPYQYIHQDALKLRLHKLDDAQALNKALSLDLQKPFRLEEDRALFIADAYQTEHLAENQELIVVLNHHHIISDGLSVQLLIQTLARAYQCAKSGDSFNIEPSLNYNDYIFWQQQFMQLPVFESQLNFWRNQLQAAPVLQLPYDYSVSRAQQQDYSGELYSFSISPETQEAIATLARQHQCSNFSIYLASFAYLLSSYSGQDDIIIGSPVANRPLSAMQDIFGFFVNTIAIRADIDKNASLAEYFKQYQDRVSEALAQQALPFEYLLDALNIERDLSHSPIFQAFFNYQSATELNPLEHEQALELDGMRIQSLDLNALNQSSDDQAQQVHAQQDAKFELSLNLLETSNELVASFEYRRARFAPTTIEKLAKHFQELLISLTTQTHKSLSQYRFLLAEEAELQLNTQDPQAYNHSAFDFSQIYPHFEQDKGVHHYIERQAQNTPQQKAVSDGQRVLTYASLNDEANRLAYYLRKQGLNTGDAVAICMSRCTEMSVALLATLKAGACYIPLDPSFPEERLSFILSDTKAQALIYNDDIPAEIFAESQDIQSLVKNICADNNSLKTCINVKDSNSYADQPDHNLNIALDDDAIFNIIYTSGSTGKPKGVLVPHRGIINRLLWMQDAYPIGAEDLTLQKTPYSFDVSVWELFWPLMVGSTLIYAKPEGHKDPDYLANVIQQYGISNCHFVPSMLALFVQHSLEQGYGEKCASLKQVFCSGEALQVQQVKDFYKLLSNSALHNLYGPTEASIDVSYYACTADDSHAAVPIGKPIYNTQLLVLDEQLQLQPIGVAGELYIGGANLALGYLNRPELNAQTFIDNPYYQSHQHPSAKLYKTGDIVRLLDDGNIAYLGRADHQVKIRGLRIELGEIENALIAQDGIKEALVLAQTTDKSSDASLCAYIVCQDAISENLDDEVTLFKQLNQAIAAHLPSYMLPQHYFLLEAMPLSANGKLDRKQLPSLADAINLHTARPIIAAANDIEAALVTHFQQLLQQDNISTDDDFFELGGHSLKAASLVSRLREAYLIDIQLRDIFDYKTIQSLALFIEEKQASGTNVPSITAQANRDTLPLSYAQQRLWFLAQLDPNSTVYNMPAALKIKGKLDIEAFTHALADVIARQEALRCNMLSVSGEPQLFIHSSIDTPLTIIDLSQESHPEQALQALQLADQQRPFDIAKDSLLRCTLACLNKQAGEETFVLLINMHHIISDAWSIQVLIKELAITYMGHAHQQFIALPELNIQYSDYAAWQREWLQGEVLDQQIDFWRNTLEGAPELLSLPSDRPRPEVQSFKGALFKAEIEPQLYQQLQSLSQQNQCTLFITCLSAYALMLQHHAQEDDICIGIPLAGRSLEGVDSLIGFFINALIIRNDLSANLNIQELLSQTKQQVLAAFAHEHVPIEMLLNELDVERNLAYTPLAQCAFNMLSADNTLDNLFSSDAIPLDISLIENEQHIAKFDMQFSLFEANDSLSLSIEYASDLFDESTIVGFYKTYTAILSSFAASLHANDKDHTQPLEYPVSVYSIQKHLEQEKISQSLYRNPNKNLSDSQESLIALTPAIEDMYIGMLSRPDSLENSMGYGFYYPLALDEKLWRQALIKITAQFSMLRARLLEPSASQSQQGIKSAFIVQDTDNFDALANYQFIDLSDQALSRADVAKLASQETFIPYAIHGQQLIAYRLYKLNDQAYYFNMNCCHLLNDGFGALNHAKLITAHYEALAYNRPELTPYDKDLFATYSQQAISEFDQAKSIQFWREKFAAVEGLNSAALNSQQHGEAILRKITLSKDHLQAIKGYCKQHVITPAIYFKAIYSLLIKLYTQSEADFVMTEFNAGRNKDNINGIGCFFHSQALLVQHSYTQSDLTTLYKGLKAEQKSSRRHLQISPRKLQALLPHSALNFSFNLLSFDHHVFLDGKRCDADRFTPNAFNSIDFRVQLNDEDIALSLAYDSELFDDLNFLQRVEHISQQLLQGSIAKTQDIDYLLASEQESLNSINQPNEEINRYPFVHQSIDRIALSQADSTAIIAKNGSLTYQALSEQSNQLAHYLIEQGVSIGDSVAVLLSRRCELITTLIAISKAGGCYIPIDPSYPQDRIDFILNDAKAKVLISEQCLIDELDLTESSQIINIDVQDFSDASVQTPLIELKADDAIYRIYTSGSTGKPKAASVYHHSESRLLAWYTQHFNFGAHSKTLIISASGFDLSQKNFFALLSVGGTVVLSHGDDYDVNRIKQEIEQYQITTINCAPSALYPLIELNPDQNFSSLSSLQTVLLGGESIQLNRFEPWITSTGFACDIVNMYGPTECTDISSSYTLKAQQLIQLSNSDALSDYSMPLGTSSEGVEILLLDKNLHKVPPGIPGEIYISGPQVGMGYWQREQLNKASFIANPYAKADKPYSQRLYKTGDLAVLKPATTQQEAQLQYIGRKDFQVKLRGLRIELGEIEKALGQVQAIKDATVLVENEQILAFVLSDKTQVQNWRESLQQQLPDYMIPKSLIHLETWPLTPNGKVDRKALLQLPRKQVSANQFIAPRTHLETDLASLWQEVLGVRELGVHDNFFEAGGDSLKAVRLIANIELRFEVKLPVSSLFGAQTIAQLAHVIHNETHEWSPIVPIQPQGNLKPIFAVHALGAMALSYEPLARALGKNQPFYGIQAYGFEDEQTPYTNLHEMVSFYTQAILETQSTGPYQLIGHSFGGLIALEIARKLKALGKEVSFIAMLDTHMPMRYQAIELDDAGILKLFAEHNFGEIDMPLKAMRLMKPELMIEKVAQQFDGAVSESFIRSAIAIIRGFQRMMINYKPEKIEQNLLLLRPESAEKNTLQKAGAKLRGLMGASDSNELGWSKVFNEVETIEVNGDHHSMLKGENAKLIAYYLKKALKQ